MDGNRNRLFPSWSAPRDSWNGKALETANESFLIISQPAWQSFEDGCRLHSRATETAGLCSFEKINKSSNNNRGFHCIPFEWDAANRPLPRQRSHRIKLEACPLCSHSAQASQRAQFGHHCHFLNDLVIRRSNGALVILREPKRKMNREGGGRVGFLRS